MPNLKLKKILKAIVAVFVILILISLGLSVWFDRNDENQESVETPNVSNISGQTEREAAAMLTKSRISFPGVAKLSNVPLEQIPDDAISLVLGGALRVVTNEIAYEDSSTGFFVSYFIPGADVSTVMAEMSASSKTVWSAVNGAGGLSAGFFDLRSGYGESTALVKFMQSGDYVYITITTLNQSVD